MRHNLPATRTSACLEMSHESTWTSFPLRSWIAFGHGYRGGQRNQNMYMIRDPTDCKWPNFVFPRYAAQIGPKALTYIRSQKRRAILCTPDAMNETTIERMHALGPSVPAGTLSAITRYPSVKTLGYLAIPYFQRAVY